MAEAYYDFSDKWSLWLGQGILNGCLNDTNNFEILSGVKKSDLDGLLLIACDKGDEKLILKLLDLGANKDAKSKRETSAIVFLAHRDFLEMYKHFVNIGVNIPYNAYALTGQKIKNYIENDLAVIEKIKLEALNKECLTRAREIAILSEKNTDLENKLKEAVSEKDKTKTLLDNDHVILEKTELEALNKEYRTRGREIEILSGKNVELVELNEKLNKKLASVRKNYVELATSITKLNECVDLNI